MERAFSPERLQYSFERQGFKVQDRPSAGSAVRRAKGVGHRRSVTLKDNLLH